MKAPHISTSYRVLSAIPGIKSWGYLPEHAGITLRRAREARARFKEHHMLTRIIKTTESFVR